MRKILAILMTMLAGTISVPAEPISVPAEPIDVPATPPATLHTSHFRWRGFMLDSARHFQSPEWVKKLIDLLAEEHFNVLHWHLTDDHGWRVEIRAFPQLTNRAAWRAGTGFGFAADTTNHYNSRGEYGGFYTQAEIREIVNHARSRGIEIVPEIEMPGHAIAALSAFPQLSCRGAPVKIPTTPGVFQNVFCGGNDETYAFLETVLGEIFEIFPSQFVHIGGDECAMNRWENCEKCQAKIAAEKLAGTRDLQKYFMLRIAKFVEKNGKIPIVWDDFLDLFDEKNQNDLLPTPYSLLPKNLVIMNWRSRENGLAAIARGNATIFCPARHCFFDYAQARIGEPPSFGGLVTLRRAYNFDPLRDVPARQTHLVLGGQACLWTEYVPNERHAEYMILPRLFALAKVLNSPREHKNFDDFLQRVPAKLESARNRGWHFRELKNDE